ncbi:AAA family ATPase [Pelagibacterales bacterium SAG-MED13]|nr:AAA family ATPase [Pelagibacterales bacterium SAG-MED13]
MNLNPINQLNLYGLEKYLLDFINLYEIKKLPNKILLSGEKGLGKSTLSYHLINYILSNNEENSYDKINFKINPNNTYFKQTLNKANPNFFLVDLIDEKKNIDIEQIRNLISNLNKSSFNNKPRFVLIDNVDLMNTNSVNALLKILEEPSQNIYFILINNNKKILDTLKSRCVNFKIFLPNEKIIDVTNKLLQNDISKYINNELLTYYFTPGKVYDLVKFANAYKYDLTQYDLLDFLKFIFKENVYKKDIFIKNIVFEFIELYLRKNCFKTSSILNEQYSYYIKRISDIKTFNLDVESILIEFEYNLLNE